MTACVFEIVSAALVGDRPRWWCLSINEAETLIRAAGTVLTVGDLHTQACPDAQYSWAIVRAPVLVGDATLVADVGTLLASVRKLSQAPWTFDNSDDDCGIITYRLRSGADGERVAAAFNGEDFDSLDQAVANARGVAELRNGVEGVLVRALAEVERLRDELRVRGGR